MDVPAALLLGLAAGQLFSWLRRQRLAWLQLPLAAAGLLLVGLATPYMYLVYLRQNPPYQLVFPAARPALYRASYGDRLPQKGGYFGFPHNNAWKVVGALYDAGVLHGDYSSNEEELVTGWYTPGAFRCSDKPTYYLIVARPRDAVDVPWDEIRREYGLVGYAVDALGPVMTIYQRGYTGQPLAYEPATSAAAFDDAPVATFPIMRSLAEILPQHRVEIPWTGGIVLRGYDLNGATLRSGQQATLALYWQTKQPVDPAYQLVIEVVDSAGRTVGSAHPHCGEVPPGEWHTHRVNGTAFSFSPAPSLPPGVYLLRATLRNPQTGTRLPLANGADSLDVASVTVHTDSIPK